MKRPDPSRSQLFLVALVTALLVAPVTAYASHQFSDVPDGHVFHDAIDWMVDNGITSGCGADTYCPGSPVTRGQMAALLKNLAEAEVVDAGRVGGRTAASLESTATEAIKTSQLLDAGGGFETVVQTPILAAGGYTVIATLHGFRVGAPDEIARVSCRLSYGGDTASSSFAAETGGFGSTTVVVTGTSVTGGTATLSCEAQPGAPFQVQQARINAISVNGVPAQTSS